MNPKILKVGSIILFEHDATVVFEFPQEHDPGQFQENVSFQDTGASYDELVATAKKKLLWRLAQMAEELKKSLGPVRSG